MDALKATNVRTGYGQSVVIEDCSLTVPSGESMSILGKNGMGKSTLAKLLMGILPRWSGYVEWFGMDASKWTSSNIVKAGAAYSPQETPLFQDLSVAENLRLGALDLRARHFRDQCDRVVGHFPVIGERMQQKAGTLSGGEQKMLLLARALLRRPRFMILDEVTEGLQPSVVTRIRDVLSEERDQGTSLLIIEQNVQFALELSDYYGVLTKGQLAVLERVSSIRNLAEVEREVLR